MEYIKEKLLAIATSENLAMKIINKIIHSPFELAEIISLSMRKDKRVVSLIKRTRREKKMLLRVSEAFQLASCVVAVQKIDGDIAEIGTYAGASSKLICELKGKKPLHLFDTFEGLPYTQPLGKLFKKGQYAAPIEDVRKYLNKYKEVYFYKGLFPSETLHFVKDKNFSLVHLDLDLYESMQEALAFFYPRMTKGGMILLHDYPMLEEIKIVVDKFFANKAEAVLELSTGHCLIVKQ